MLHEIQEGDVVIVTARGNAETGKNISNMLDKLQQLVRFSFQVGVSEATEETSVHIIRLKDRP